MPKTFKEQIHLYGLFDAVTDICYYVGQTRNPAKRREQHFNPSRGKALKIPNAEFRLLRLVLPHQDPATEEENLIRYYRSIGQASMNSDEPAFNYAPSAYYLIHWEEQDITFRGFGEAGRRLGCTPQTIKNQFSSGVPRIKYRRNVTLTLKSWPHYFIPQDGSSKAMAETQMDESRDERASQ